jgi:FtsP/CotA-like multicopper oxidase with cupredoxin domain
MARAVLQAVLLLLSATSIAVATQDAGELPTAADILLGDFDSHPYDANSLSAYDNKLTHEDSNGLSPLGTLDAPKFHPYMGAKSLGSGMGQGLRGASAAKYPWGSRTAKLTDAYHDVPVTGETQSYNFVIERGIKAPDGVPRHVMLINGEFPGPTIVANWGDTINVTVENRITDPEEGVSLHWHGILHRGSPWEDGVPGISQHPIAPNETFTYSFTADLYGSTWYHSHYSAQYADGVFGAMIIHGPNHVDYDEDLGPVLLSDTYHRDYFDILEDAMGNDKSKSRNATIPDNNLIQGMGPFDCSQTTLPCTQNGTFAKFGFESGKSYRLRLINAGADAMQEFSIDGHTLTVIANDMVPIVPYETTTVRLGIGQRSDVVVVANSTAGAVWMRSTIPTCARAKQPNGLAIILYDNTDPTTIPTTAPWPTKNECANDDLSLTQPWFPLTPSSVPDKTLTIEFNSTVNATGNLVWTMNESTFRVNYNDPVLFRAQANDPSFVYPTEWNVMNLESSESVRLVVINHSPIAHPMHMHGHNYYVESEGPGYWDESTIVRPENPQRRDTQIIQGADRNTSTPAHLVLQIDSDNPGVWPFHW